MNVDDCGPMNDTKRDPLLGADLDARIAGLSPEKRALLSKRLSAARSDFGRQSASPIKHAPRTAPMPLSFAQQRLWFLEQWEGGSALYNIPACWWLQGPLDVTRLQAALTQLVVRHEALRTAIVAEAGAASQRVMAALQMALPVTDLRALPPDQARNSALAQAQDLARQGFDLAQPPLLRGAIYCVAESTHLLVLVMHHIISDGWSMGVLYRELGAGYAGQAAALPDLPVQYPDYALWQREQLQGAALERQLVYWRSRLADLHCA